jgi:hypothetical protein
MLMKRVTIAILAIACIVIGIVVTHDSFVPPDSSLFPQYIFFNFGPSLITLGLLLLWIARTNILKSSVSYKVLDMALNILLTGIGLIVLFFILSVPIFFMGGIMVSILLLEFLGLPGLVMTLVSDIVLLRRRNKIIYDRMKFSEYLRSVELVIGLSIMTGLLIGIIGGRLIASVTGDNPGFQFLGGIIGLFVGIIIGIRITNKLES